MVKAFAMTFVPAPLDRLRSRLAGLRGRYRYGASVLDQIVLSVFGFGLSLSLVRALSATDYGMVSLWMTLGLLTIGIQDALVNGPLSTHVPAAPDPPSARRLAGAIAIVNLLAIAAMTGLVVLVNVSIEAEWTPRDLLAAITIPVFVAAGMYREFYRSLAFSRHDMAMLLWIDGPYVAVTTLCLAAMFIWPERFANLAIAFLAISAGCIAGQLCLRGRFAGPKLRPFRRGWWGEYRKILRDVSWALVGVLTTHLHGRSYVYVTVNLVGLAGLAAITVVGLLFRPVRIMVTSWGRTALPELATYLADGQFKAFDRAVVRAFAATIVASAVWPVALWLGWHVIERHFLAGQYPDAWLLVLPWAIAAALDALGHIVSIPLRAAREFKFLACATVLSAPVTIGATAGAIIWQGYTWTMYGVALGNLLTLVMCCGRLYAVRREIPAAPRPLRPEPIEAGQPSLGQP